MAMFINVTFYPDFVVLINHLNNLTPFMCMEILALFPLVELQLIL